MSTKMTKEEREAFLADLHVGIIGLNQEGRGPMTVPIWYDYRPGGDVWVITGRDSRKGNLIREGDRLSLCVQTEEPPYSYVSVEGPVVSIADCDTEQHTRPMAHRYLGQERGDAYIESTRDSLEGSSILVTIRPERWLTVDYGKA